MWRLSNSETKGRRSWSLKTSQHKSQMSWSISLINHSLTKIKPNCKKILISRHIVSIWSQVGCRWNSKLMGWASANRTRPSRHFTERSFTALMARIKTSTRGCSINLWSSKTKWDWIVNESKSKTSLLKRNNSNLTQNALNRVKQKSAIAT